MIGRFIIRTRAPANLRVTALLRNTLRVGETIPLDLRRESVSVEVPVADGKLVYHEPTFGSIPTPRPVESTTSLCGLDGTALLSAPGCIPARSARRILWERKDLPAQRCLMLASDALAAPNAKPLLFQHYQGRFFSAAHT